MRTRCALALLFCALVPAGAAADPLVLRVGTSGDYAPFSVALGEDPIVYQGFDIAVAESYAKARGLAVEFVSFRWRELRASLVRGRFDVAMSGVTVRPERSAVGRFTVPVAQTGAVVLVRHSERFRNLDALNRGQVRIGVNAGGHLERVARARFSNAVLVAIPNNAAVRESLLLGKLDAVVTDTLEAPKWLIGAEDWRLLGPFTVDRKAYLVSADRPELAADLDAWLLDREADGTLERLRDEYFGAGAGAPMATPLGALLAAMDERLALMPLVGVSKRRAGLPLEVPEREALVLDAAVAAALGAARRASAPPPPEQAIRRLFRAQMDAAKQVQWSALRDPEFAAPETVPDLVTELRPALLRIGDRIGQLLVALPTGLTAAQVRKAAQQEMRTVRLSEASRREIADAIAAISAAPRGATSASAQREPESAATR